MTEPLPSSRTGDTRQDATGHLKNKKERLSLSSSIVRILQSEPDYPFTVRDLIDRTCGKPESVRRIIARLSKTGKDSGPVRKIEYGMYQYAPEKEHGNFRELIGSG